MMDQIDFFMGGQVVGAFPSHGLPTTDGSYRYEPYRSPGHLNLHMELKAGKVPRCFFINAAQRVSFCVTASPSQGVLTLVGVEVDDDL
jgi:hypothetical protein